MDSKYFTFRRYKEDDAEVLYQEYVKYALENIQPYFWGPSVVPERRKFLEGIRDYSNKKHRPPLIADESDQLFGVYRISFKNANRYHRLILHLWENKHLTKQVLERIINEALLNKQSDSSILVEVPGFGSELKRACEELGLKCMGTIPQFLCHGKELYDWHFYVTTAFEWFHEDED